MKIAFFLLHYPVFSETFVSKEILTLQNLGLDGIIVCEKKNFNNPFHPHIKNIKFPILEISQKIFDSFNIIPIFSAHLFWLIKNPIGYIQSLKLLFSFFNYHHLRVFIKTPFLAQKIKKNNIDLIYVHEVDSPSLYGLICSKLLNIPCGIIFHTQYLFSQNKFLADKIKNADFTVFQSHYSLNQAKKISKLPSDFFQKSFVISTPGIDTNFFKPQKNIRFSKQIKIISIGRLEEAKGFPNLLKSIKILKKIYPDILLTIIGDGSQKEKLITYIRNNNLQKNIILLGALKQDKKFIKIIQNHNYFILPSIVDSQKIHDVHPNVVKEAMSCGLLTITSLLGGIDEIIKNNQNGFLIKNPTSQNISNIILKIHALNEKEKTTISQNTRKTILDFHQQEKICQKLKEIFLNQINEK